MIPEPTKEDEGLDLEVEYGMALGWNSPDVAVGAEWNLTRTILALIRRCASVERKLEAAERERDRFAEQVNRVLGKWNRTLDKWGDTIERLAAGRKGD